MSTRNSVFSKPLLQKQRRNYNIPNKQKLRKFITNRSALQEMLKGVLQAGIKGYQRVNSKPYKEIKIAGKGNYIGK